jgi:lipopolysaccharide export LptBFGC system permease protein LptF
MKLLDRYIARQYLINVLVLLIILCCFVVMIDVSLNIDRYWKVATTKLGSEGDSLLRGVVLTILGITDLWWPRLLSLFNFLIGLVLVGAMGFTCTQLVRNRELVAVLTAGQSLFRVARPFLFVAIALTALQVANQEIVIPRIAPLLMRDQGDMGRRSLGVSKVPPTVDAIGRVFYASSFDADRGTLENLYVWERDRSGLAERRIFAPKAEWTGNAWRLTDAVVEPRASTETAVLPGPELLETNLDPALLKMRRFATYGSFLGFEQASAMLDRLDQIKVDSETARKTRDQLQRISLGRISTMCANILTLIISMSFFLTREPKNMVLQALKCAPVGITALIGGVLGTWAPVPGVPAWLSVFIPVIVLTPIAVATVSRVRT